MIGIVAAGVVALGAPLVYYGASPVAYWTEYQEGKARASQKAWTQKTQKTWRPRPTPTRKPRPRWRHTPQRPAPTPTWTRVTTSPRPTVTASHGPITLEPTPGTVTPSPTPTKVTPTPTPTKATPTPTPTKATPSPTLTTPTPTPTKITPTPTPTKVTPTPDRPTDPPPTGGFPNAGTTGPSQGTKLTKSGPLKITKDGTVIENLEVHGDIDIYADDVVIRNTRVIGTGGNWAVLQRKGHSGLRIEDSEISGDGRNRTQVGVLNQGGMLTVLRSDIHTITDGIYTDQGVIEDNYLHDPVYFDGDHTDMITTSGGPPKGAKLVIRHNTVINTLDQTGAIALFQDFSVVHDVLVEGNYLAGGGYSLYGGAGKLGKSSNIKIVGNVFSRAVWPKGGYYGPVAYFDMDGPGNVWSGNVWEETGTSVAGG
ncbi:hypothetical protein [Thermoactinospora rubra]|uniref:hypothetical protein n=1 Tax=Thermoactinospora rubra TaxID=1088767 RepID=UPI00197F1B0B|nr:hypothetical protein [Thermoactinospora rubra]